MKKRAGLARALALDPEILFLDEPTAGLDPIGAAAFDELIRELQRSLGLTVFMVTHDLDTLVTICDRIAVLVDKKVVVGTIENLLQGRPSLDPGVFPRAARPRGGGRACRPGARADGGGGLRWRRVRAMSPSAASS